MKTETCVPQPHGQVSSARRTGAHENTREGNAAGERGCRLIVDGRWWTLRAASSRRSLTAPVPRYSRWEPPLGVEFPVLLWRRNGCANRWRCSIVALVTVTLTRKCAHEEEPPGPRQRTARAGFWLASLFNKTVITDYEATGVFASGRPGSLVLFIPDLAWKK